MGGLEGQEESEEREGRKSWEEERWEKRVWAEKDAGNAVMRLGALKEEYQDKHVTLNASPRLNTALLFRPIWGQHGN